MNILNLTSGQLKHAANLKDQIAALENQLAKVLGGGGNGVPSPFARRKKNRMSRAGRLAIIAAQKARWAKVKGAKRSARKRTMSAAARAKIAAAARRRWKAAKAAGKTSL